MTAVTIADLALYLVPITLGIIGYIIKRGLERFDVKMDASVESNIALKESINKLAAEVAGLSILGDQRQLQCDERMSRVYGELTSHSNILDKHADKLQEHELKISKLEKK